MSMSSRRSNVDEPDGAPFVYIDIVEQGAAAMVRR